MGRIFFLTRIDDLLPLSSTTKRVTSNWQTNCQHHNQRINPNSPPSLATIKLIPYFGRLKNIVEFITTGRITMIQFQFEQFRRLWLPNSPIIYRYMNNEFINKFFQYGEIRLTSYKKFREEYKDEIRGDDQEGSIDYRVWNKSKSHNVTLKRIT